MRFRLNKTDDAIELELFLKAVKADEDYQKIRFLIKDGLVSVNGEKEYARRRLLFVGDKVAFRDRYYVISSYKKNEPRDVIKKKISNSPKEQENVSEKQVEKIVHHKKPMRWSQKYNKDE